MDHNQQVKLALQALGALPGEVSQGLPPNPAQLNALAKFQAEVQMRALGQQAQAQAQSQAQMQALEQRAKAQAQMQALGQQALAQAQAQAQAQVQALGPAQPAFQPDPVHFQALAQAQALAQPQAHPLAQPLPDQVAQNVAQILALAANQARTERILTEILKKVDVTDGLVRQLLEKNDVPMKSISTQTEMDHQGTQNEPQTSHADEFLYNQGRNCSIPNSMSPNSASSMSWIYESSGNDHSSRNRNGKRADGWDN